MSLSRVINCNHYVSLMAKYKCITLFTNDFNQKDILQAWTFLLVELRCCPITGGISPLIHWLILLPKRLLICIIAGRYKQGQSITQGSFETIMYRDIYETYMGRLGQLNHTVNFNPILLPEFDWQTVSAHKGLNRGSWQPGIPKFLTDDPHTGTDMMRFNQTGSDLTIWNFLILRF